MVCIPWAATKIATPQTPTTTGAWPESRCRAYLLPNSLDMPPAVAAAETRANLFYASNTLALKRATRRASYYLPPTQRPWVVGTPWLEQRARLLSCCCEEAERFPSGRSPRDYASRAARSSSSPLRGRSSHRRSVARPPGCGCRTDSAEFRDIHARDQSVTVEPGQRALSSRR